MLRLRNLLVTAAIATAAAVASAVALASHAVAAPRDKMMMGIIDGGEDMMHNGVVLDPYNRQHGHLLPANPAHLNFWATLMADTGSERLRVSFARGVHPSFDLTNPSGSDITVRGGIPPYSSPVPLSFECIHNNTNAPETAIMDVAFLDTPTADPVVFYFDKECTWPLLNIGMNENTASIWHLGKHVDWTYLAHPDDDQSKFYFWMDETSTYEALTYSIRSIDYDQTVLGLTYDISEPVARKFKLGTPESSLTLQYTCHNNLPFSQTTIHVVLNFGWKAGEGRDIQFIWVKQCSASHTGNPRHGFDIGTQPGVGDVIKNGVVQHDWSALSSGVDKKIFYDLQKLTFYAFINDSDIGMNPRTQDFSLSYYTDVKPGDHNAIYDIITSNITSQTARVGSYVEIGFQIVCKVAGTAITRVNLVMDHYGANAFFFEKTCTFPKLQIGTTENVANVVVDSKVIAWNYNEASKKTSTKFFLWVPQGDAVSQQHFLISHVNWDHNVLSASVKIVGDNIARPLQMGTPEASITFMYQCYDTVKPGTLAAVNMTIDIGWQGEQLTWAWHKQCGEVPTPAPSGWSAFGIFAFTVFMLTLIGCLGGCMYNYFGPAAKRGLRVVPGHSVFASCYDKLVTPKAYTPQTSDYTYNAAEEKAGAGYQTDL